MAGIDPDPTARSVAKRREPTGIDRHQVRCLARAAIERGEPLAWFEEVYQRTESSCFSSIPWADLIPNPNLVHWLEREGINAAGRRALVVGCGLGDDAEELSRRGFAVTAFDVSSSAIAAAAGRFPDTEVEYLVADLFDSPATWRGGFDLVYEAYTLQVLPSEMRRQALRRISSFASPKGILLLIARARDEADDPGEVPWPLTRAEVKQARRFGLEEISLEDYFDGEHPLVRRFRAVHRRPGR